MPAVSKDSPGFDHICTKNPVHAFFHPTDSMAGQQCQNFVRGRQCDGRLKAVGDGSRKANRDAQMADA